MKTIIAFALLLYSAESGRVNEQCYSNSEKEVLKSNLSSPYQLAIDHNEDMLFFSYTSEDNGKSAFESAFINLKNNEFKIVKGIVGGFANAVDVNSHTVYLGGENGIYTFDYESNIAKHVNGTDHKIWQMFFKKHLYYTTYPEEDVYILRDNKPQRVPQLNNTRVMLVAVDNYDNIYFSNLSGLYFYEKDNKKPISITFIGYYIINGFTTDVHKNLYFSTPNGIYSIDESNKSVKQLVLLDDVYGLAIEYNGNLIYSTENSIIRLKPNTQC